MASPRMPGRGHVPPMRGRMPIKKGVLKRLLKILFTEYKALVSVMAVCVLVSAIAGSIAGLFLQQVYDAIGRAIGENPTLTMAEAWSEVIRVVIILGCIYVVGWASSITMGQVSAVLTQRFLRDMRLKMFGKMQTLPIKYFDRNTHGDIMSKYSQG